MIFDDFGKKENNFTSKGKILILINLFLPTKYSFFHNLANKTITHIIAQSCITSGGENCFQ